MPVFIGLDLGTQGVRATAVDENGALVFESDMKFDSDMIQNEIQDIKIWEEYIMICLKRLSDGIGRRNDEILSISVTSTSGTVFAVDHQFNPVFNAVMYHDRNHRIQKNSFLNENYPALEKMLWIKENKKSGSIYKFLHANDFLIHILTGEYVTDYSSALKSGYDAINERWADAVTDHLSLSELPEVKPPGEIVGMISKDVSSATGLPGNVKVVLGMTDGCTGLLSTGCSSPGEWCTTIGSTLVIKGISESHISDDIFYSHKHPDRYWMPGGASNTGAKWVSVYGFEDSLQELTDYAGKNMPSETFHYPLTGTGERFPFESDTIQRIDCSTNKYDSFLAGMEGVAFIERMAYEKLQETFGVRIDKIYTSGSAGKNKVWNTIRSNILNRPIVPSNNRGSSFGAAVIAAGAVYYKDIQEASINMASNDREAVISHFEYSNIYNEKYEKFKALLEQHYGQGFKK